jgi:hypothetical protein
MWIYFIRRNFHDNLKWLNFSWAISCINQSRTAEFLLQTDAADSSRKCYHWESNYDRTVQWYICKCFHGLLAMMHSNDCFIYSYSHFCVQVWLCTSGLSRLSSDPGRIATCHKKTKISFTTHFEQVVFSSVIRWCMQLPFAIPWDGLPFISLPCNIENH